MSIAKYNILLLAFTLVSGAAVAAEPLNTQIQEALRQAGLEPQELRLENNRPCPNQERPLPMQGMHVMGDRLKAAGDNIANDLTASGGAHCLLANPPLYVRAQFKNRDLPVLCDLVQTTEANVVSGTVHGTIAIQSCSGEGLGRMNSLNPYKF